jgi:Zn-dependent peptidase ImmA (M78 family)
MAEQLPVTPKLITWARERAGLSLEEATKTFARIEEWEKGESSPTYGQLEQLAGTLKLPIAVFFFPQPPEVPEIQKTFRTLPEAEFSTLPSRVQLLLRKAKALQLNLIEMTQGRNPAPRLITRDLRFETTVNIDEMAKSVRDYLGVAVENQAAWADDEDALKRWRSALVDVGVYVFKDAFKVDEYSGFCLYDDAFPIIYLNNSSTKTRQTFSIFHELAHLLFHTSGIDSVEDSYIGRLENEDARRIEVLCNRFAARFLVPDDILDRAIAGRPASEQLAYELAAYFHVSREAIYRRFLERRTISQQTYEEAAERWAAQKQPGGKGGDYYWTKLAYLGRDYVALALRQFHQNRIDEGQLAEYLDVKPKSLEGLEQYFERGAA